MAQLSEVPFVSEFYNVWVTVGPAPIVFEEIYDADQLWLPFATGIMFRVEYIDPPYEVDPGHSEWSYEHDKRTIRRRLDGPVDELGRSVTSPVFPPPEREVPQYVLPFEEYRYLLGDRRTEVARAEYPTFDRNDDGELFKIERRTPNSEIDAVKAWCLENLEGRFIIGSYEITIERRDDFLIARLRF